MYILLTTECMIYTVAPFSSPGICHTMNNTGAHHISVVFADFLGWFETSQLLALCDRRIFLPQTSWAELA